MKGIVFTEFLEMVEKEFGYETVDQILEDNELASGGAYTSVGTYNHAEMIDLLGSLSAISKQEVSALLHAFGRYIFDTFLKGYPQFFEKCAHGFEFLESIDGHIHVEVKKLYPDAMLPRFDTTIIGTEMAMNYYSDRRLSDFASGLIERTMEHYGHGFSMQKELMNQEGSEVKFTLKVAE